jgi:quinol-cytochrome oxidoreductase complex cytochrome b subunit
MAFEWKISIPLVALLFVLAIAKDSIKLGLGFVGITIVAVIVLFLLPILNAFGMDAKTANPWFIRAAILLLVSAVFTLVPALINIGGWAAYVTDLGIAVSILILVVGSLIGIIGARA